MSSKYSINILKPAMEELELISDYYMDLFGRISARKVTNKIIKFINKLKDFPYTGVVVPDLELSRQGYRMVVVEEFISIYRVIENVIFIYHIASTRTDYIKLFSSYHKRDR